MIIASNFFYKNAYYTRTWRNLVPQFQDETAITSLYVIPRLESLDVFAQDEANSDRHPNSRR